MLCVWRLPDGWRHKQEYMIKARESQREAVFWTAALDRLLQNSGSWLAIKGCCGQLGVLASSHSAQKGPLGQLTRRRQA